jgi:hypothetical protein
MKAINKIMAAVNFIDKLVGLFIIIGILIASHATTKEATSSIGIKGWNLHNNEEG